MATHVNTAIFMILAAVFLCGVSACSLLADTTPEIPGVDRETQQMLLDVFKDQSKMIVLGLPTKDFNLNATSTYHLAYGTRNTRTYKTCTVSVVRCVGSEEPDNEGYCAEGVPNGAIVSGQEFNENPSTIWVTLPQAHVLDARAVDIQPMALRLSGVKKDAYKMEFVTIEKRPSDASNPTDAWNCSTAGSAIDPLTNEISQEWREVGRMQFKVFLY